MKFNIVIDRVDGASDHGKDVVDGLNAVDRAYLNKMLFRMYNPGYKHNAKDMMAHSCASSKKSSCATPLPSPTY
eukprot:3305542-Ditylum_brightwellii.AAC.1